ERFRFDNEQVSLRFIKVDSGSLAQQVTLTDEEVQNYFDQHKETFRAPERVRVDYVVYPTEKFADQAAVTDAEVQQYYDGHQVEFTRDDAVQPLDAVRADILNRLKHDKMRTLAHEHADADHDKVAKGETLADVAKASGFEVVSPPPFTKTEI